MLLLFKKIRKALLRKNKVTTYILYALGEIILVVIGILIALQINIVKENNEDNEATKELLLGMEAELELEVQRIDFLEAHYTKITDGIQTIILYNQGKLNPTNEELGQYFLNALEFRKFSKFNTSYQTLSASGLLQRIENKELSKEIVTYYTKEFLEWSLEIYEEKAGAHDLNDSNFKPLDRLQKGKEYTSIPNFEIELDQQFSTDFRELTKDPRTQNFLFDLLDHSEFVHANLNTYKETNRALADQIKNYLKP